MSFFLLLWYLIHIDRRNSSERIILVILSRILLNSIKPVKEIRYLLLLLFNDSFSFSSLFLLSLWFWFISFSIYLLLDFLDFLLHLISWQLTSLRKSKRALAGYRICVVQYRTVMYVNKFIKICYFSKIIFILFTESFIYYVRSIRKPESSEFLSCFSYFISS
jgi:hypothetical protein